MAHTTKTVPGEVAWRSDLRLGEVNVYGSELVKPQGKRQSIAGGVKEARFTEPGAIATALGRKHCIDLNQSIATLECGRYRSRFCNTSLAARSPVSKASSKSATPLSSECAK